MKRTSLKKVLMGLAVAPLALALLVSNGKVNGDDKTESKQEVKKTERAQPRGRLPAYFAAFVSQEQRERVYQIQSRYSKQIEDLERQIDELTAVRDQEVDGVLTPEQLEKVNAKRAEAEAKRASRSKKAAPDAKPDKKEG